MILSVPPYRVDVQREADVIEEILRIYGFNRVEIGSGLRSTLSYSEKPDKEQVINPHQNVVKAETEIFACRIALARASAAETVSLMIFVLNSSPQIVDPTSNR